MGLGLRGRICGRGWGRAPAPPSSAEGERCGCPGSSAADAGGGTTVGEGRVPGWGWEDSGGQERSRSGSTGTPEGALGGGLVLRGRRFLRGPTLGREGR